MTRRVLVPRLVDAVNVNAQVLNARGLLSRFGGRDCLWHCVRYGEADPDVAANPAVTVTRLAPWRFWRWHLAWLYQCGAEAIFYPGVDTGDWIGLHCRDWSGRPIPVIATLEGLVGDAAREQRVSRIAGHPVYCQSVTREVLERVDYVMHRADHVIAISPFLARVGGELYGDKFSVLPLGVDIATFTTGDVQKANRTKVVSVGHVSTHKRPEVFLSLAERFRDAQFCWIGDGEERNELIARADQRGIPNISFPGPLPRSRLAEELRSADIFVMVSRAEGVPKAIQEAAASGLPCVVFGHYQTPSVVDGENGYVVWSDAEFERRLSELLSNGELRERMGRRGREMAQSWDWNIVAAQWEQRIVDVIEDFAVACH
jgi:glycosyltransferase involved in cell wall biosynthesis